MTPVKDEAYTIIEMSTLTKINVIFTQIAWIKFFYNSFILHCLERGTKPILTPNDGRRHFGMSGIRTCVHLHGSPELYHCATDANLDDLTWFSGIKNLRNVYHSLF